MKSLMLRVNAKKCTLASNVLVKDGASIVATVRIAGTCERNPAAEAVDIG